MSFNKDREGRFVFGKIQNSFQKQEDPGGAKFTIKELDALFYNQDFLQKLSSNEQFTDYCKMAIKASLEKIKKTDLNFENNLKDLKLISRIHTKKVLAKLF